MIAYDRLIRDTPNVDYYATFDNFQVGVLQAQSIEQGARAEGRQGPVQHRIVRRLARRQQRLLLLQRRDVGAAALYRQRQAGGRQRPDGHGQGLDACAGTAPPPRRAWTICSAPSTATSGSMPCCRPMTASRSASSRRSRASAMAAANSRCRSSPARMPKCRRSSRCCAASSIRPSSRTPATSPRSPSTWSTPRSAARKSTVNDTKTYNNGVKVVPSYLLKPVVVDKTNWEKVLVDSGYYKRSQFD